MPSQVKLLNKIRYSNSEDNPKYKYLFRYPHSTEIQVTDSVSNIDLDKVTWIKKIQITDLYKLKSKYQYIQDIDKLKRVYKSELHNVPYGTNYRKLRTLEYKSDLDKLKSNAINFNEVNHEIVTKYTIYNYPDDAKFVAMGKCNRGKVLTKKVAIEKLNSGSLHSVIYVSTKK